MESKAFIYCGLYRLGSTSVLVGVHLCVGLGGIFALIDFIKILTDKYVVDPTKAF